MGLENVPRCQHVKVNGTQCGSPALRSRRCCYFHDRIRREQAKIAADVSAERRFDLPLLEDANSVQVALMKVIQMLGSGRLDHKTTGLMLYALQTASTNLRNAEFEVEEATDVVIDRDDVHRTIINGQQWFEEDFEDDPEDEADGEDALEGEQAVAAPIQEPPDLTHVSIDEARLQMKEMVRDWVLEKVGEKVGLKPS
ncbi:MAG: hypothetical protein WBV69_05850 [Candidatus Sulfotelmatobacter sp.]